MRSLIIGFVVFLSACNGSDKTIQIPYSDPALVAKVDSLTKALAAATHEDAQKFSSIQLNGPEGVKHGNSMNLAISNGIDFGPCSEAGTKVGQSGSVGLDDETQVFKQTPTQTCPGVYSEYDVGTGSLHTIHRIYYTSNDCTGNMYEWEASGAGYNTQTLKSGVVFMNPVGNGETLMVQAGQTSQPIQMQSAWVIANPGCQSDVETQLLYLVSGNNVQISGIPNYSVGAYSLSSLN